VELARDDGRALGAVVRLLAPPAGHGPGGAVITASALIDQRIAALGGWRGKTLANARKLRPVARVKDPVPGREDEIVRPSRGECYEHKMVIGFSAE